MKHNENSRFYKADDGKMIFRKSDGKIMGDGICLGDNDSIDNYEEREVIEEVREQFFNEIGMKDPKKEAAERREQMRKEAEERHKQLKKQAEERRGLFKKQLAVKKSQQEAEVLKSSTKAAAPKKTKAKKSKKKAGE